MTAMPIALFMRNNMNRTFFTTKEIVITGVMAATLEAAKISLSFLPNVELVTLLLILYTLFFGWKTLVSVFAFVGVECAVWGVGLWTVMYLYIWPLLVLLTLLLRRKKSVWVFAVLSALFGLFFGALCALPYLFIGGVSMAFTWWIAGIPYDMLHCVSNFILCLVLFRPLQSVLERIGREIDR